MKNISAVILAAGSGTRIGIPKLKLIHKNEFFVNIISINLKSGGINNVVCIIRKDDTNWFKENADCPEYIVNYNPELGMLSSVKLGIEKYLKHDGVLLFPVDHPFVTNDTIKSLISDFKKNTNSVIKPFYKDKSGHPLIIPGTLFKYIVNSDNMKTLNDIIKESGISEIRIDVDDEGILKNVNSIEDLKA